MRKTICRSSGFAVLVVGALAAPAPAAAQADAGAPRADSATAVHVVRRGDTLWDLAISYLRSPLRWREIHAANRDVVENPHWIYPGERLRIPGTAAPSPAPADVVAAGAAPAPPPATVGAVRVTSTIAGPDDSFVVPSLDRMGDERSRLARRLADYLAAPYLHRVGGPAGAGSVRAAGLPRVSEAVGDRWLQLGDAVRLTMPDGVDPEIGQKLIAFALGDRVHGGQIVRPTGIVEVIEFEGATVKGRVIVMLEPMHDGNGLLPLPALPADGVNAPAGAGAAVAWVADDVPLPSLQSWLLLAGDAGVTFGVQDEVQLFRTAADGARELLGTARVARVEGGTASVFVTGVTQPGIGVGTRAQVRGGDRR